PQSSILYPPSSLRRSAVDEIDELPASADTLDAHPVAIIVQRLIGELRRSDPELSFLYETLRQDGVEFRPEPVFVPVLKYSVALAVLRRGRSQNVGEIFGHHRSQGGCIVRRHGLFQPPDECLKINVRVFVPQLRLRAL